MCCKCVACVCMWIVVIVGSSVMFSYSVCMPPFFISVACHFFFQIDISTFSVLFSYWICFQGQSCEPEVYECPEGFCLENNTCAEGRKPAGLHFFFLNLSLSLSLSHTHTHTHTHIYSFIFSLLCTQTQTRK